MKLYTAIALAALLCAGNALASDHKEAPSVAADPSTDIADLYAFLNPRDHSRLVLSMTVGPSTAPEMSRTYQFSSTARYLFKVDNDGDYLADHEIEVRFSDEQFPQFNATGTLMPSQQFVTTFSDRVRPIRGPVTPSSQVLPIPLAPIVSTGQRGIQVFAGQRDDPFFFDSTGSFRVLNGRQPKFSAAIDRNAGFNVSAIVIELPLNMYYRGRPLHIWCSTEKPEFNGGRYRWKQIQRDGNPAIKAVYITAPYKDLFNASEPVDDPANFSQLIAGSARYLFQVNDEDLAKLLAIVSPDVLRLDPTKPIRLPNGRGPDDDIDPLFWFNLNRSIAYAPGQLDGVAANDVPNSWFFPYLAPPHTAPMY